MKAVFLRAGRRVMATPTSPTARANPQASAVEPRPVGQRDDQLRLDAQAAERHHAIRLRRRLHHVDLQASHAGKRTPRSAPFLRRTLP